MTAIPNAVFNNSDVRLRVWFNNGTLGSQMLTPDQRIAAVGYAMIAGNVPDGAITSAKIAGGAVGGTQLAAGAAAANLGSSGQSGVASGGIILSPDAVSPSLASAGYVKIGQAELGEFWQQRGTSTAPAGRYFHSSVWTGSEMIVWGGTDGTTTFNDGKRYNPALNTWTAVSTTNAPAVRRGQGEWGHEWGQLQSRSPGVSPR